jgi:hypothetical protein
MTLKKGRQGERRDPGPAFLRGASTDLPVVGVAAASSNSTMCMQLAACATPEVKVRTVYTSRYVQYVPNFDWRVASCAVPSGKANVLAHSTPPR